MREQFISSRGSNGSDGLDGFDGLDGLDSGNEQASKGKF